MLWNQVRERASTYLREFSRAPSPRYDVVASGSDSLLQRFHYTPRNIATLDSPQGSLGVPEVDGRYWSFARVARIAWGVATTLPYELELHRLMKDRSFAKLLCSEPRFRFKFLIRDYLVRKFTTSERTACFLHHYKRLQSGMPAELLLRILHEEVVLFDAQRDDVHLAISLCYSRPFEKEGELSLNLHVDGDVVFVLSFTIAPGWVVQSEAKEVLLISRLQGTNGYFSKIRSATKAMHDVGPVALLLATLDGFGRAFNISQIAGVSALRQSTYSEAMAVSYRRSYDDCFSGLNITCNPAGFFVSPLPLEDKPMSEIKKGHKIRTREKRKLKSKIAEDVFLALLEGRATRSQSANTERLSGSGRSTDA